MFRHSMHEGFGRSSSTRVLCTVLYLGMLTKPSDWVHLAPETGQISRKRMAGETGEGKKNLKVSSSFSPLLSVLEPSFLSSRRGGRDELCIGCV